MPQLRPINDVSDDFAVLRKNHAIYVDKTAYVLHLISDLNSNIVFASRPRRFGKSLTISTLKYIFQGRRDLFAGLAIDKSGWEWKKHPIIHFAFNDVPTLSVPDFEADFTAYVKKQLVASGYEYDDGLSFAMNFGNAIDALADKSREAAKDNPTEYGEGVVILVDEYDAPVGHALGDVARAEAIRDRMSSLYAQMKNRTGNIRFLFMTGASKFTKPSVFSALSNIKDVSMLDDYATMFGYTEEELTANFEPHLRAHAAKMGLPYDDYRAEMKRWYNGFRFAKNVGTTVYNHISVAYTLKNQEPGFTATWATTGRRLPTRVPSQARRTGDRTLADAERILRWACHPRFPAGNRWQSQVVPPVAWQPGTRHRPGRPVGGLCATRRASGFRPASRRPARANPRRPLRRP